MPVKTGSPLSAISRGRPTLRETMFMMRSLVVLTPETLQNVLPVTQRGGFELTYRTGAHVEIHVRIGVRCITLFFCELLKHFGEHLQIERLGQVGIKAGGAGALDVVAAAETR